MVKPIYKILFCLLLIASSSVKLSAATFASYLNDGKWATAKQWLLNNKTSIDKLTYYSYHVQLCGILNEQELSKSYLDTLYSISELKMSDIHNAQYHLGLSRYYKYHKKNEKALSHAQQALQIANKTTDIYLQSSALLQLGLALKDNQYGNITLLNERPENVRKATDLANKLTDNFVFLKSKLYQLAALVWLDEYEHNNNNKSALSNAKKSILTSNEIILKSYRKHPQLVHNLTILGYINAKTDIDLGLKYYQKAESMLSDINDAGYGILISLSSTVYHLLDRAYEIKFNQTHNVDFLNRALVRAKQNLWLDNYKIQYEGFYYYRRYNNRENPPVEQRITNLYIKLYNYTKNKNYLSFALKYAELMRHKPITQIGVDQYLYASLSKMVSIEDGKKQDLNQNPDYLSKLITQPEYVAGFLNPNEALITYFCYGTTNIDSLTFLVQVIQKNQQYDLILKVSKTELGKLPEDIFNSIEQHDIETYKIKAYLGYNLLLKPIINKLATSINKLIIIPPAYFSKPILFEGFVKNLNGNQFNNLSYVFDDLIISYATSLTHFVTHKRKQILVDRVTVWNPDYTHTQLAEITEGEIINKNISKYFTTNTINYTSKKEIAEALLKSKVLQISAHANASFDNMDRPIIYTALKENDSVLYDIDFEKLKSENSLAVFAACKSNVGVMQHNGIIDGFTRATLSAGGAGTVCALRNVEESVTTQLLDLFYKYLSEGRCSSEALHLAKKEIKKQYSDPKIWQAFIYTGAEQRFVSTNSGSTFGYPFFIFIAFAVLIWILLKPNLN